MLYLLISKVEIVTILEHLKLLNPLAFILAAILYAFSLYISSIRWSLFISQPMKVRRLFSMYMIGSFFNICLPGIIGGDALKAYYLSRELSNQPHQKTKRMDEDAEAIASVFMDRYIGFSALLSIGMLAFPFGLTYIKRDSNSDLLLWIMPTMFFLFTLFSFLIFRYKIGLSIPLIKKIYEFFSAYSQKKQTMIKAFLYSIIIQGIGILSVYILSKSMSFHIPLIPLLIFIPMIIVITLLPISISGIGVREFAFILFLGSVGVSADISTAISLTWFFSVVLGSLWGLVEYLRFKTSIEH